MEGRRTGTAGNKLAQQFIIERFRELKLQPPAGWTDFAQKFSFVLSGRGGSVAYPDATNLVGMVAGTSSPEQFLIVSAHYDHLGQRNGQTYRGADDNASGVAALLQVAAYVAAHPPRHSVLFAAFDAEEEGLQGAKYFVKHPPVDLKRIALVVNLDMVSRNDKGVIFASGTAFDPSLKDLVGKAAAGRQLTVKLGHDRRGVAGEDDWTQQSDQGAFHDAGVKTLYFGVEDHADYHKPGDTADKIPRPFYGEVVELVLQTVLDADALP
jgi:Zn-dependent M28 family amino/carboxypeptidase